MMINESSVSIIFSFSVYGDMDSLKYLFASVVFILYVASVLSNGTLILLIYLDASLHKPMYIFLFSLIMNGLLGSTAVWPKVMNIILTGERTISYTGCLIQVFFTAVYGACNYTLLTIMAYDRLVSIFQPLHYHSIMTSEKVRQLLLAGNIIPYILVLVQVCLTSRIPLCCKTISRLLCDNLSVSGLSCEGITQSRVINIYGVCTIIVLLIVPLSIVLLSYAKILWFILKVTGKARRKAFETCSPHIIVFVNFSVASLFAVVYNRIHPHLPVEANILITINYILVPPLLHPVIYGIKTKEILQSLSNMKKWALLFHFVLH